MIYGSVKYKHGQCHILALALHRVFGYQIAVLEDKDREVVNERTGVSHPYYPHVFCIKGRCAIDGKGVRRVGIMVRESGIKKITHPRIMKISPITLYKGFVFQSTYGKVTKKAIREAEEFVLRNREKFVV